MLVKFPHSGYGISMLERFLDDARRSVEADPVSGWFTLAIIFISCCVIMMLLVAFMVSAYS